MKSFTNSRKFLFGLSVSMVLAMAIGSFALGESQTTASPRAVGATVGSFTVNGGTQGTNFDYSSPVLTIHSGNLTVSTTAQTSERIVVDGAATITLAGVNIDRSSITTTEPAALTITDNANFDVKILLADNATNILKGATGNSTASPYPEGSPGIEKSDDGSVDIDTLGTLTIGVPDGSQGTGKLEATGGYRGAGIGGGYYGSGSNITITGGEVTATGGSEGASIGGGYSGDGSKIKITGGVVTANGYYAAGIGGGEYGNGSDITISGGKVIATGGFNGAGIGGGGYKSGSNIEITGGEITATGGNSGAGIGGGYHGSGSYITISGDETKVTAIGGTTAAGIGGGLKPQGGRSYGNHITITGGVITAIGGNGGAGIGGGHLGSASDNSLNGDAVVMATSGYASKEALEGFVNDQQESLLTQGIAFTGLGTAFDSDGHATDVSWDESGTMYDSVTLYKDLEMPANLTVPAGNTLTVNQGVTLKIPTGKTLKNDGTITINNTGTINCQGTITTKTDFYFDDGSLYNTGYQTYRTSAGVQKYTNLPNPYQDPANGKRLINWYYLNQAGQEVEISENVNVLLNEHSFHENSVYTVTVAELENGSITPDVIEAAKDDTVTLTVTPDEGYQISGLPVVESEDGTDITVTAGADGEYTFTMPGAAVEISATFEETSHKISVNQPDHGTVTTDPDNPKTGDEVIITVTPEEGYEIDGLPIVKTEDGRIIEVIPTGNPNEYKFIMPNGDVTIEVNFVFISEPTVDPDVKTGDSFAGIAALAILGVVTTGAVMLRKRK